MDALLHWPAPHNPAYEAERDALSEWELDRRLAETCREQDRLECLAGEFYGLGWLTAANWALDRAEGLAVEYAALRRQLDCGGW